MKREAANVYTGGFPRPRGLYDPANEHDSCGVGFVAHIKGVRSRQIIDDATEILRHLVHRGACGCEPNTGDGAGMLTALPHEFLSKVAAADLESDLPPPGHYGVGIAFLPTDPEERRICKETVNEIIREQGQILIGWRPLPTRADEADIGPSARAGEPAMEQLFIAAAGRSRARGTGEATLYYSQEGEPPAAWEQSQASPVVLPLLTFDQGPCI